MAYIWHTNLNGEIEFHPDAIPLLSELNNCTQDELKFIVLYKDYRLSPIKDFPDIERESLAKKKVGFDVSRNILEEEKIIFAMEEFESLIYDERRQLKRIYQERLEQLKAEIRKPSLDLKELKEKKDFIEFFRTEINRIDTEISSENYDDDALDIKGKRQLSYIEKWQRRRKKYAEMTYE